MTLLASSTSAARQLLEFTLPPLAPGFRLRRLFLLAAMTGLGLALAWLPVAVAGLLLAGAVLVSLLLLRPVLSLYLLIPLIPFSPLVAVTVSGFRVGGLELVLAAGLAAWLLQLLARQCAVSGRTTHLTPPLLLPFFIFLGTVALSWLTALSIRASLVETAKWVEMLALYLFVVSALPRRQIKWVVGMLLLAAAAQALLGLYQFVYKAGPPGFLLFGGRFLRAYGTFAQPNPYAGYLGLVLPLVLSLAVWAAFERKTGPEAQAKFVPGRVRLTLLFLALLGLLLAALFASQSRAAWLGFAVAAAITLVVRSKRAATFFSVLVLAGLLVVLAGTFETAFRGSQAGPAAGGYGAITQRFVDAFAIFAIRDVAAVEVNDANFATIERLAHWQAARAMWRDHPWLGVGFGNYEVIYPAYAVGRWFNSLGHAHNYLLNIGAETGLVGISGYLIFWILALKVTWQALRHSSGFERAVAAGALGILAHLHIHNFFDNLYVQGMYLHVAIILALATLIDRSSNAPTGKRNYTEEDCVNQRKSLQPLSD